MHSHASTLLLTAAATSVLGWDYSNDGSYGAPYPDVTYPGFASENPISIEGSQSFQVSPPTYPSPCESQTPVPRLPNPHTIHVLTDGVFRRG